MWIPSAGVVGVAGGQDFGALAITANQQVAERYRRQVLKWGHVAALKLKIYLRRQTDMRKIRVTTAALARSPALTLAKLVLDVSVNHAVYGQCLDNDADGLEDILF